MSGALNGAERGELGCVCVTLRDQRLKSHPYRLSYFGYPSFLSTCHPPPLANSRFPPVTALSCVGHVLLSCAAASLQEVDKRGATAKLIWSAPSVFASVCRCHFFFFEAHHYCLTFYYFFFSFFAMVAFIGRLVPRCGAQASPHFSAPHFHLRPTPPSAQTLPCWLLLVLSSSCELASREGLVTRRLVTLFAILPRYRSIPFICLPLSPSHGPTARGL